MKTYQVHDQESAIASPWSVGIRVKQQVWELFWPLLCSWTPKQLRHWRTFCLRLFGAQVSYRSFVHSRAVVIRPWNLTMHDFSAVGDGAVIYGLNKIEIETGATVAQEAYICTGSHDFDDPNTPLKTAPIRIGAHAFIGLRAIILPGVEIAAGTLVGAGSVVSRDTEAWGVYAGNPARKVNQRRRTAT